MSVAHIAELWRYPVKSMGGELVEAAEVGPRGLHADRLWAVRDLEQEMTGTARRLGALLGASARYAAEPGADAGPGNAPEVVVTFPDGTERSSSDPSIDDHLSRLVGRRVRLSPLPPVEDTRDHRAPRWTQADIRRDLGIGADEPMPDTSYLTVKQLAALARWATPPGTYVDFFPLHVLSTASLRAMAQLAPGSVFDVRRFRPNVLVETELTGQPERDWCGARLHAPAATLAVAIPTVRCVAPTRAQPDLERDPQVMRTVAAHADRHLGVYATVERSGRIALGDELALSEEHRGRLEEIRTAGTRSIKRLTLRAATKILP